MGAWGYLPRNSDGAHDLFFKIDKCANLELENITADKNTGYHYAGLIMILLQGGFFIKHKFVAKARDYVKDELEGVKAGNHKSGWKDPELAEKKIGQVLQEFDALVEKNKNYYLTTNMLGGMDISKRTMNWRLKKLDESTIFAPNGWLDIDETPSSREIGDNEIPEDCIPIKFDDIFWEVQVAKTDKKNFDEPIVELQWGWSAGMTDEERKAMDEDSPSGYKSLPITLSAAKRLAEKINALIENS